MKICKCCALSKSEEEYYKGRAKCKICVLSCQKEYAKNNSDKYRKYQRNYYSTNEKIRKYYQEYHIKYKLENINTLSEYSKKYAKSHKDAKNKYRRDNKDKYRERYRTDPKFFLRKIIASSIRNRIKKCGNSVIKYLPYTIEQLKQHLESQFESWMTWENHGTYDSGSWDDSDPKTWTWQIDHIIPHSTFKYVSMEDTEFQKCWALENLRPLSAKQNILDRDRR